MRFYIIIFFNATTVYNIFQQLAAGKDKRISPFLLLFTGDIFLDLDFIMRKKGIIVEFKINPVIETSPDNSGFMITVRISGKT